MTPPRCDTLASGPGWSVTDVVCSAGPHDRAFEEQHEAVCIALVLQGSFEYRTPQGSAVLAPGAILLGNHGQCFTCGHDHAAGDHCLSFHFAPDHLEAIASDMPGVRRTRFGHPRLPPSLATLPLIAEADRARKARDAMLWEEFALRLGAQILAAAASLRDRALNPTRRDASRITEILRRIEAAPETRRTLADFAREAGMSPFHFLRTFRAVAGMTPHQFVLRTRLQRVAARLRDSAAPISVIALDAGFEDLSTFNRRFRHVMGVSPRQYRAGAPLPGT